MTIKPFISLKKSFTTLFALAFLITAVTTAHAQNKGGTLIGYVVVPDLVRTLDQIQKVADSIDPEKVKSGTLKSQAGAALGDPAFENIDRTRSTVIMFFHNPSNNADAQKSLNDFEVAFFIPAKDKTRYQKTFEAMNLPNDSNGETLIISNKKSSLLSAQREMKLYRKISAQRDKYDMRMLVKIDTIMSVYNAEISMLLNKLQVFDTQIFGGTGDKTQQAAFFSIGKIFLYALADLAAQSKDYQLDVSLNDKSLNFYSEYSAKPGSQLSSFFDGTPPGANKCLSLLPERSQLTYAGYLDMKRLQDLIDSLLAGALKHDPSIAEHLNKDLIDAYKSYTGLFLGEFAVTYGFSSNHLQIHLAAATDKSSEEYIAVNDRFMEIYNEVMKKAGGELSGFSGYTIQKNFRKSSGIDVHRYVVKMDSSLMKEGEKEMMQKMFGKEFSTEYAVANGFIVASTTPAVLDKIIANTISGGEKNDLISMNAFGTGMDSYYDFDVISFVEKIFEQIIPVKDGETKPEKDNVLKVLKNLSIEDRTLLYSSKYSKGISYNKYQVSMKMITELVKFFNEQKKQAVMPEETIEVPAEDKSAE